MGKDLNGKDIGKGYTQRKDGLYLARFTNEDGERFMKTAASLDELKAAVDDILNGAPDGHDEFTPLNVWFDYWFKEKCVDTKRYTVTTTVAYSKRVHAMFLDKIGHKSLKNIRDRDIQGIVNKYIGGEILNARGELYSRKYVASTLKVLTDCFHSAYIQGIIRRDPCADIVVNQRLDHDAEYKAAKDEEQRWLSQEEIGKFLEVSEGTWYYEMMFFMIFTGLRVSEVGGLTWEDIDFKNGEIHVRKGLKCFYLNGVKHQKYTVLKTTNGKRVLPMEEGVKRVLLSQKRKVMERREELGAQWREEEPFENAVFVTQFGSPATRYVVEKAINSIVKDINEEEMLSSMNEGRVPSMFMHVNPHALRHTFCSLCFRTGLKPEVTRRLMGHAHLATTVEVYTHFSNEELKTETARIGDFMCNFMVQNCTTTAQNKLLRLI